MSKMLNILMMQVSVPPTQLIGTWEMWQLSWISNFHIKDRYLSCQIALVNIG